MSAVRLGLLADLIERLDYIAGNITVTRGIAPTRTLRDVTPSLPLSLALRRAARTPGIHASRALLIPWSANDPGRR